MHASIKCRRINDEAEQKKRFEKKKKLKREYSPRCLIKIMPEIECSSRSTSSARGEG